MLKCLALTTPTFLQTSKDLCSFLFISFLCYVTLNKNRKQGRYAQATSQHGSRKLRNMNVVRQANNKLCKYFRKPLFVMRKSQIHVKS